MGCRSGLRDCSILWRGGPTSRRDASFEAVGKFPRSLLTGFPLPQCSRRSIAAVPDRVESETARCHDDVSYGPMATGRPAVRVPEAQFALQTHSLATDLLQVLSKLSVVCRDLSPAPSCCWGSRQCAGSTRILFFLIGRPKPMISMISGAPLMCNP